VHLLDLLLLLAPEVRPVHIGASGGFWGTGVEEDVLVAFEGPGLVVTVRVSHIRWVNDLRIEVVGDDGYAFAEGRGGNYGPMTSRVGARWGWHGRADGRSQRETEERGDHDAENRSLDVELEHVLRIWSAPEQAREPGPQPATMAEGRRITELVDDLYARLGAS
jgi:predicted dehydrogenase